jgi:hypothetical protein
VNLKVINVVSATQIGKYQLHLCFDDQSSQDVDFGPFLSQSQHPYIRAYLDDARFSAYRLEYGELVWGDFDLCFPIIDLYNNQIEKHTNDAMLAQTPDDPWLQQMKVIEAQTLALSDDQLPDLTPKQLSRIEAFAMREDR